MADPVLDAGGVELQLRLVALRDRVVETDALDGAAVALVALVGHDDVVERTLLGAAAGQTDLDHGCAYSLIRWAGRAGVPARRAAKYSLNFRQKEIPR